MVKNKLRVEVKSYYLHHILVKVVEMKSVREWWFLRIYGWPEEGNK